MSTTTELARWDAIWLRPQAIEWARLGLELEVAMYLRAVTIAESADAKAADRTAVRQAQDALGLSIPGMLRNRWRIADLAPVSDAEAAAARSALTVLDGFGA